MKRRAFLIGGASAVAAVTGEPALSQSPPVPGQPLAAGDLASAAARLRAQFLKDFEPAYVENVIIPLETRWPGLRESGYAAPASSSPSTLSRIY